MSRIRLFLRIFWMIMLLIVIGRIVYRFVIKKHENNLEESIEALNDDYSSESTGMQPPANISYDFKKLIKLLDASAKIKHEATTTLESHESPKKLDKGPIEELLKELLYERVILRNYILDLKGYSTMGISIKKYRSLMYYLEILEHNISDMRTLLKKRELFALGSVVSNK